MADQARAAAWSTAVSEARANDPRLRGLALSDLCGEAAFSAVVFVALTGRIPSESQLLLLDSVLVANVDSGPEAAAAQAARQAAATGAPPLACLAAGLLAMGPVQGTAAGGCLRLLNRVLERTRLDDEPLELVADQVGAEERALGRPIPGFGHELHPDDRRAQRLLSLAGAAEVPGEHLAALRCMEDAVARLRNGARLRPNLAGATAAVLGELGFGAAEAVLLGALARMPGLAAHLLEERRRFGPGRRLGAGPVGYDGTEDRPVPAGGVTDDDECVRVG